MNPTADTLLTSDGCLSYAVHIAERVPKGGRLTERERAVIRILKATAIRLFREGK